MPDANKAAYPFKPIYLARIPWIGPVVGTRDVRARTVRIAVAADPAVGEPHIAAFVPVRRSGPAPDARFERLKGGWWREIAAKDSAVSDVEVQDSWLEESKKQLADGLLVTIIYNWSREVLQTLSSRTTDEDYKAIFRVLAGASVDQSGVSAQDAKAAVAHLASRIESFRGLFEKSKASSKEHLLSDLDEIAEEVFRCVDERIEAEPARSLAPGLLAPARTDDSKLTQPGALTFAVASCQFPAGFLDREVASASYARLAERVCDQRRAKPDCLLLLGDQVYVDSTAGLFDPSEKFDRYEEPHERLLRLAPVREVLRRIPLFAMLDDHEIVDNWENCEDQPALEEALRCGREAYLKYQRKAGPPLEPKNADNKVPLWYQFAFASFPFFMADTRTERKPRTAQATMSACIMGDIQFGRLRKCLDDAQRDLRAAPKFVASPACFLPRHVHATPGGTFDSALRSDAWDGYPASLFGLLEHIVANDIENVIFLSGDEHLSFAVGATVEDTETGKRARLHSIHSSGLYSPLPFSNAAVESLRWKDEFRFGGQSGVRYVCTVRPIRVMGGDGFALLRAQARDDKWSVQCLFDRAGDTRDDWFDILP